MSRSGMVIKHKVEYFANASDGSRVKITQEMTQAALSKLLAGDGIVLISVNRDPYTYRPPKKKK